MRHNSDGFERVLRWQIKEPSCYWTLIHLHSQRVLSVMIRIQLQHVLKLVGRKDEVVSRRFEDGRLEALDAEPKWSPSTIGLWISSNVTVYRRLLVAKSAIRGRIVIVSSSWNQCNALMKKEKRFLQYGKQNEGCRFQFCGEDCRSVETVAALLVPYGFVKGVTFNKFAHTLCLWYLRPFFWGHFRHRCTVIQANLVEVLPDIVLSS